MEIETFQVSVRTLAEFVHKRGSLDIRFTPAPTALQGMQGHLTVTQRRPPSYQTEVALTGQYATLTVTGRCDGYDPQTGCLEEIKTHRVAVDRIPDNHQTLHRAQARLYAAMICRQYELSQIDVCVVYFHISEQTETRQQETLSAQQLSEFFNRTCEEYLSWAETMAAHVNRRNRALMAMPWPYPDYRKGQRELAKTVYVAGVQGQTLLMEAPTGLGKTMGNLFPMLKAMPKKFDRLFYLTSKNSGKQLALDAVRNLGQSDLQVLELTAKAHACEHPDKACHGDACPLAYGLYDRLPKAREQAQKQTCLDRTQLKHIAAQHQICPYFLGHEMAKTADLIVADCAHVFDSQALLFALSNQYQWRCAVVLDEAHNLVSRARGMYSVTLRQSLLETAIETAPPRIRRAFNPALNFFDIAAQNTSQFTVAETVPENLIKVLQNLVTELTQFLADAPVRHDGPFMEFYFAALSFVRLTDYFDSHSVFTTSPETADAITPQVNFAIENLIPAYFLAPRFQGLCSTVLFSATLKPFQFQKDLLGMPASTQTIELGSPFESNQLAVHVSSTLSTRYQDRQASLPEVVSTIGRAFTQRPGNYLAFFSSYQYLFQVEQELRRQFPQIQLASQTPNMSLDQKQAFIDDFTQHSQRLGLAVLGGTFGEGIDLTGDRLIGVFITTTGMPAVSQLNEVLRERLDQQFGCGFDYAYRIPGLQKVIQAAGRVIRTQQDKGNVWLLDHRYGKPPYRDRLPAWWRR